MKKFLSMTLAIAMAVSLFAGCGKNEEPAATSGPASALELMETVWAAYADEEKFSVVGGSMAAPVDGAPGEFDLADENITFSLMIPADQLENVTQAASLTHMLNSNTFTAAAFKLNDGIVPADFAAAMQDSVVNNQWICGFPEQLLIVSVPGGYVVSVFGAMDLIEVFKTNLTTVYPDAAEIVNETLM